ncbi:MAG: FAD-binding oxidoreductase, partial [Caulobacterales bacterium]|nr:FAD-binding oxidoreductase [Caulobacterales bacterium]
PIGQTMTVEAGAILADIQQAAEAAGFLFPLSLGAEGSCQIGGNLATNAGGNAVLRYGNCRELTLGLEAVLPDGRIWNGLSALRKNNTGYDLKQLLIGAEGTLGVVTAASLKLFPVPAAKATAFAAIDDPAIAPRLLALAKKMSGDAVTAFELVPAIALDLVAAHIPGARAPLAERHPWCVLIEMSFGEGERSGEVMEATLTAGFEAGLVRDAALAASASQAADFWRIRESIPEAETKAGPAFKHDVSTTVSDMPRFLAEAEEAVLRALPGARIIAFGHVGDGNIHFNVVKPDVMTHDAFLARHEEVTGAVYEVISRLGGSISAEHGVGVMKRADLAARADPVKLDLLRAVKRAIDPKGVMNPRVMIETESAFGSNDSV